MKFITEFELTPDEIKYTKAPTFDYRKQWAEHNLGGQISFSFGFKETGYINADGYAGERRTLEIEAFPMDKWVEFKQKLTGAINYDVQLMRNVVDAITELESFGKPKGEKI